ncbi:hypothetical protein [Flavobacterium lindanitolerans]|uniref:MqsR (Motility quorum-sensing regulator) toxin of toxin-antitoxin system n=1 Tax=Flavobacterium lindanitolerans TaxID=428988 RepID=A0A497UKN0_9FLAO|nr:hypothetical protein [Flavobacterium lindanitolerans]MBC8644523.1 hypothetical protein [Flavobacterium lindanitolerans]PKW20874.1 hypothetical protein B0G92_2153 [Flavobacterium lindanitolerans]RLJ30487.1 hypothetical protein CLV50_1897 [Flavobacterium lindanitolerans]
MNKQEILQKVQNFLDNKKIKYIKKSLDYLAFKEKGLVRDGTTKGMHLVTYDLDFKADFPVKHTVVVDSENLELMYIVTPHGYIEIEK